MGDPEQGGDDQRDPFAALTGLMLLIFVGLVGVIVFAAAVAFVLSLFGAH
jgi:hypothetical protein